MHLVIHGIAFFLIRVATLKEILVLKFKWNDDATSRTVVYVKFIIHSHSKANGRSQILKCVTVK